MSTVADCIQAGARGIAAIRMLSDPDRLGSVVNEIREIHQYRER